MSTFQAAANAHRRRSLAILFAYMACGYVVSIHLGSWVQSRLGIELLVSNPLTVVCAGMAVIAMWPAVIAWWLFAN